MINLFRIIRADRIIIGILCLFICSSCRQGGGTTTGPDTMKTMTNTSTIKHPYGVLVNTADGVQFTTARRLQVMQALGVSCVRDAIAIPMWTGSSDRYESFAMNSLKVVLNINSSQTGENVTPMPYPSDVVTYKASVTSILNKYQPELIVIENEEENDKYHVVEPDKYIALLRAAIEVARSKSLKICNGGITARVSTLLVWDDYYSRGLRTEAADYARRSMPAALADDLPEMKRFPKLKDNLAQGKQLVAAYKTMDIDFVNFHWYEPIQQRENTLQTPDLPNINSIDTKALEETIAYYKRATGKTVITNEIGTINRQTGIVQQILQKTFDLKLPYVLSTY